MLMRGICAQYRRPPATGRRGAAGGPGAPMAPGSQNPWAARRVRLRKSASTTRWRGPARTGCREGGRPRGGRSACVRHASWGSAAISTRYSRARACMRQKPSSSRTSNGTAIPKVDRRDPQPLGTVHAPGPAPATSCDRTRTFAPGCRSAAPTLRGRRPRATPCRRGHRGSLRSTPHWESTPPAPGRGAIGPSDATGQLLLERRSRLPPPGECRPGPVQPRLHGAFGRPRGAAAASASLSPSTSRRTRMARCSGARPASVDRTSTTVATSTGATAEAHEGIGVDGILAPAPGGADRLSHRDPAYPAVQGGRARAATGDCAAPR